MYIVFDWSVSQSVSQSDSLSVLFYCNRKPLRNFVKFCRYLGQCVDMHILPGYSISFILGGILALSILEFWPYIKYDNEKFVSATPRKQLHGI